MEQYFKELFAGESLARVKAFLYRMEQFKAECTNNLQEDYIREGLFAARAHVQRLEAEALAEMD